MRAALIHLVRSLVAQGLIDPAAVVDGGLTASTSRSRNRFAVVKPRSGPGYFVKQPTGELLSAETIAREAELYRLAAEKGDLAALGALMPPFHSYDPDKHILVTGFVPDADNLTFLHERLGVFPPSVAGRIGAALAALHAIAFAPGAAPTCFARRPHWILHLRRGGDVDNLRRSAASSQVVDLLLAAPRLADQLEALRETWTHDSLIHADVRWENILLAPRAKPVDERGLVLIDWELADIGDPSWDVGGALQCHLNSWITSMPAVRSARPDDLAAQAKRPLDRVQPAMDAFWRGYVSAGGASSAAFLERCVGMMAARMLVTAFEICAQAHEIDARVMLILQTALNVLDRPGPATEDLLGIGRVHGRVHGAGLRGPVPDPGGPRATLSPP